MWKRRRGLALVCVSLDMEWYGIAGAALLGLSFYLARRVPSFLASGAAVVAGFVAATRGRSADRAPE